MTSATWTRPSVPARRPPQAPSVRAQRRWTPTTCAEQDLAELREAGYLRILVPS
ncbi:hypothetical protein [Propioniciclava flava]